MTNLNEIPAAKAIEALAETEIVHKQLRGLGYTNCSTMDDKYPQLNKTIFDDNGTKYVIVCAIIDAAKNKFPVLQVRTKINIDDDMITIKTDRLSVNDIKTAVDDVEKTFEKIYFTNGKHL